LNRKLKILSWIFLVLLLTNCSLGYSETAAKSNAKKAVSPNVMQRIDLTSDLYLRQIGDGAFVITHAYPWPANSLLVEMADGSLVIAGSTYTPDAARSVLLWAKNYFGQRPIIAIDTGYHVDNLGGNEALLDAGIPVYGSDLTAKLLQERGESTRQLTLRMIGDTQPIYYKTHASLKFYPPDHLFPISKGLALTFHGEKVKVFYPGPSQAPDKVVVYFPSRKLLLGSCMILGGEGVGNVADADLHQWPNAIRKLFKFPVDVVIPGHGTRLDPGLLQHTLDLLVKAP
jgi:metallo-beta-lactamase class B